MNNEDLVLKMILDESGFSQGLNSAVKSYKALMLKLIEQDKKAADLLGAYGRLLLVTLASGATKIISKGIGLITATSTGPLIV